MEQPGQDQLAPPLDTVPRSTVPRGTAILLLMAGAQFMVVVDETVVNVAIPSVARDLAMSTSALSWVVNAYLLFFGGFLLVSGRLADAVGKRRLFLAGLVLFAGASGVCGLAGSSGQLIGARAAQGLGAALMSPTALSILTTTFHDQAGRRRALAVWGALLGLGATAGVLLGGVIVEYLSWPWIFYVNVPIAIVIGVGTLLVVPGGTRGDARAKVDVCGAALVTAASLLLVHTTIGVSDAGITDPATMLGFGATVGLLAIFVIQQRRATNPLLPAQVLGSTNVRIADMCVVAVATALFGGFFMITLWMQMVQGWEPLQAGLSWAPQGLTVAVVSGVAARLMPILGSRILAFAGLLTAALAQVLFLRLPVEGDYLTQLLPALLVNAIGLGLILVPLSVAALDGIGPENQGVASGLLSTAQQLGGAVGLAALVSLASARFDSQTSAGVGLAQSSVDSFHLVFLVSAVLLVGAAMLSLRLPALRKQTDLADLVH
jgi:EmrB/QacA subfamily drug resistance transporter